MITMDEEYKQQETQPEESIPVENTPTEEAPAKETPTEEVSTKEAPVEEVPKEEAPAEEVVEPVVEPKVEPKAEEKAVKEEPKKDYGKTPMLKIKIAKVTLNIGAGTDHAKMEKGIKLLKMITGIEPIKTVSQKRIPSWGLRPGLPVGCKITLRGKKADEVLARLLKARDDILAPSCFDNNGNISFGIKEYIDIPGVEYDQEIGITGLQATVTLERPGYRIKRRLIQRKKVHGHHRITQKDAIQFVTDELNIKVE
jgi:large subunit ribosomal protein L5